MKVPYTKLVAMQPLQKVVVHSLDCALYQASIIQNGVELFVTNEKGTLMQTRCLVEMQSYFNELAVDRMVLRQQSAYDEMIGLPGKPDYDNALEVPIASKTPLR